MNTQLSFRARGLLSYVLEHNAKRGFLPLQSEVLMHHTTEGRDAVRRALKELEDAGYVERRKYRDPLTQRFQTALFLAYPKQ